MIIKDYKEYGAIKAHYGSTTANRSGLLYMKHIDDGIKILNKLHSPIHTQRAWCIHPIIQVDESFMSCVIDDLTDSTSVAVMAVEYRSVANRYLRPHGLQHPENIQISPLTGVNKMLIADKVQNYHDAMKHQVSIDRSLILYFESWLRKLGVDKQMYKKLSYGLD